MFEHYTVSLTSDVSERALQLLNDASAAMVPKKSKKEYLREFARFTRFSNSLNLRQDSERTMVAWFEHEKQVHGAAASTMWKRYSAVKCILQHTKYEHSVFFLSQMKGV